MTGKNTLATHPEFGIKARVLIAVPYRNIIDQMVKEAINNGDRKNQTFVHSSMDKTLESLKVKASNKINFSYDLTLKNSPLPYESNAIINTTYNQLLNLTDKELETLDYVFIDESHALTNDLNFRADVISKLIFRIITFVSKMPNAKTKFVFMSGTPNVETKVIEQLMDTHGIKNKFQKIKIDKQYAVSPTINLVHLDTTDKTKREDLMVKQITKYISQGRKVICVYNHKEHMSELQRVFQTKIGKKIKVGCFHTDSSGKCTENILSRKIGDYDVVLVTNFFINGINIDKDGLDGKDLKAGKTSTQKYAVVVDVSSKYSQISAIQTIQAVNRFRNRLCEATVFFPKMFIKDEKYPNRNFRYDHAVKTLFGINKYNYHLLADFKTNVSSKSNEVDEVVTTSEIHYLREVKINPTYISTTDIQAKTMEEENKMLLQQMITKEERMYTDWYLSMDGYNYLCKDAGFKIVFKHIDLGDPLKAMTEDQIELENKFISTVFKKSNLFNLIKNLGKKERITIMASDKIINPINTSASNFYIKSNHNQNCIIEGDFHSSHELCINKLSRCFKKLAFLYDSAKATEIISLLINPKVNYLPFSSKRFMDHIARYVRCCNVLRSVKFILVANYITTLDTLSKYGIGIHKDEYPTFISYTIKDQNLVKKIKNAWAEQQYSMIEYKMANSNSGYHAKKGCNHRFNTSNYGYLSDTEFKEFKLYFGDKEKIMQSDLENLEMQLKHISQYTQINTSKDGIQINNESIIIPRILKSEKVNGYLDLNHVNPFPPEEVTQEQLSKEHKEFEDGLIEVCYNLMVESIPTENYKLIIASAYCYNQLKNRNIVKASNRLKKIAKSLKSNQHESLVQVLEQAFRKLSRLEQILLTAFKSTEFIGFKKSSYIFGAQKFYSDIFFCQDDFTLKQLINSNTFSLNNISIIEIYNNLNKVSKKYLDKTKIRVRTKSGGRKTIDLSDTTSKYKDSAFVVLDKKNRILYADFDKKKACQFLCSYAFKGEGFKLKDGKVPVKKENRGIYNPSTFKKDYYPKKSISKTVDNYSIEEYTVNVVDYVNHITSV